MRPSSTSSSTPAPPSRRRARRPPSPRSRSAGSPRSRWRAGAHARGAEQLGHVVARAEQADRAPRGRARAASDSTAPAERAVADEVELGVRARSARRAASARSATSGRFCGASRPTMSDPVRAPAPGGVERREVDAVRDDPVLLRTSHAASSPAARSARESATIVRHQCAASALEPRRRGAPRRRRRPRTTSACGVKTQRPPAPGAAPRRAAPRKPGLRRVRVDDVGRADERQSVASVAASPGAGRRSSRSRAGVTPSRPASEDQMSDSARTRHVDREPPLGQRRRRASRYGGATPPSRGCAASRSCGGIVHAGEGYSSAFPNHHGIPLAAGPEGA